MGRVLEKVVVGWAGTNGSTRAKLPSPPGTARPRDAALGAYPRATMCRMDHHPHAGMASPTVAAGHGGHHVKEMAVSLCVCAMAPQPVDNVNEPRSVLS